MMYYLILLGQTKQRKVLLESFWSIADEQQSACESPVRVKEWMGCCVGVSRKPDVLPALVMGEKDVRILGYFGVSIETIW